MATPGSGERAAAAILVLTFGSCDETGWIRMGSGSPCTMPFRWVPLLIVLLGCGRERGVTPSPSPPGHLVPWRHLVDELEGGAPDRHPFATVGDVTRYVVSELPALELAGKVISGDRANAEVVIACPPEFSGRSVGLRPTGLTVSDHPAIAAALAISPSMWCPAGIGAPASVRFSALRSPETAGSAITLIGTAEPAERAQTRWLRIPTGSVLEVAFGMANPANAAVLPAARFEMRAVGRDGSSVTLLRQAVDAEHVAGRREWLTKRIALGRDIESLGPEVCFVFETSVAERDRPAFPVWGDPVILVPAPPAPPERRNVVLISLDTLRADRLGCYGAIGGNTPVLDRMAGEGTLFEVAIAAAPWTTPSHATLPTGFHGCVHRLGLGGHHELPAGIAPLPELLRHAGYTTAAFTEGGYLRPAAFQRGFGLFSASNQSFDAADGATSIKRSTMPTDG